MGSAISPHVHWVKTTSAAGTVKWTLSYRWADLGETLSAWSDADAATLVISDGDTAEQHALSEFSEIIPPANVVSSMMLVKIARVGGDDTYAADAKLLEFDIHFQADSVGSTERGSKD